MKRNILIGSFAFLILFLNVSCTGNFNKERNECFPYLIVEDQKDTFKIGEIYNAKVYFSDTSLLYINDPISGKRESVYPIFKVNGEVVDTEGYLLEHKHQVNSDTVYKEVPSYREWTCSIIFPHPNNIEGDIEITKLITYTAVLE